MFNLLRNKIQWNSPVGSRHGKEVEYVALGLAMESEVEEGNYL